MKYYLLAAALLATQTNSQTTETLVVEVNKNEIKLNHHKVDDLAQALKVLSKCEHLHFIFNKDLAHKRLVELLNIATEAGCEKVSVQST